MGAFGGGFGFFNNSSTGGGVTQWTDLQVYYVGKGGNDSNNGKSVNKAFLTIGAAITAVLAQIPSTSNRFEIQVVDAGIYTENISLPDFTILNAPASTIVGTVAVQGNNILIASAITPVDAVAIKYDTGSSVGTAYVYVKRLHLNTSGGFNLVEMTADSLSQLILHCDYVTLNGDANFFYGGNSGKTQTSYINIGNLAMTSVTGTGTAITTIQQSKVYADIKYLVGNSGKAFSVSNTSEVVAKVDNITCSVDYTLSDTAKLTLDVQNTLSGTNSKSAGSTITVKQNINVPFTYFVSKAGNDNNSGLSSTYPKLTIASALADIAANQVPSATNRFYINVMDAGIYIENISLPKYIEIYAPNAVLKGTATITEGENSIEFWGFMPPTATNAITITGVTTTGKSYIKGKQIVVDGNGTAISVATTVAIDVYTDVDRIEVTNGTGHGIYNSGASGCNVYAQLKEMKHGGSGNLIYNTAITLASKINVIVNKIFDTGSATGIAVNGATAQVEVLAQTLNCNTAYNLTDGILRSLVLNLNGTQTLTDGKQAILQNLVSIKYNATTAPTVNDDSTDGYGVGSNWYDTTNDRAYICLDSTPTAAVWKDCVANLSNTDLTLTGVRTVANAGYNLAFTGTGNYGFGSAAISGTRFNITGESDGAVNYALKVNSLSNNLFSVRNDGNVGIGTSTLTYKVNINSTLSTDFLKISKNGVEQAVFGYQGINGGFFNIANEAGTISLMELNGLTYDYLNTGNNFGIGTSTPDFKLTIQHTAWQNTKFNSATDCFIRIASADVAKFDIGYDATKLTAEIQCNSINGLVFAAQPSGTERARMLNDGSWGLGTATPEVSAKVDITSTTQGFLPPRMTAAQASAITSVNGLMLYVTDTDATFTSVGFWGYEAGAWVKL